MKNNILSLIIGFLFIAVIALAGCSSEAKENSKGGKETSFKVYGNCEMCKKNIEGSLKDQDGINLVNWDVEKKMIAVSFDPAKIQEVDIHKKIAAVGYDTEKEKGSDEAYNSLHKCCQYDRKK